MKYPLAILAILFIFLAAPRAQAQFHFVKSTVWFINGDSVAGWIDEAGLQDHTNRIRFKLHQNDVEHTFYTSAQVSTFKLNKGAAYLGYVGEIDSTHYYHVLKDTMINPRMITDTLFLKPLVIGKANLYYALDKHKIKHYFIQDNNNNPPRELRYYFLQWTTTGIDIGIFQKTSYHYIQKKIYKQQMLLAFNDCPQVFRKFAKAQAYYAKYNLKRWFRMYNNECG